jgi:RNA polymerase-binding protein DksA
VKKKNNKKSVKRKNSKISKPVAKKAAKKMKSKELLEFKNLLLKIKDEILDDIKHISDDTLKKSQKDAAGDISGYTYHMADVATDTYDREFSLGLASKDRQFIYELDDAMKKIEDGIYGFCESCKALIAKTRLKAVPYARLCVKCQEKKEKK